MKKCELCMLPARTYCESDQASLCWDCDAKVHGANFLVARHSRCLLCHTCQSLTPWTASGSKLGHTVSVCDSCINHPRGEADEDQDSDTESTSGGDGGGNDDSDDDGNGVEDGENQVVPWTSATPPPPVSMSTSSSSNSNNSSSTNTSGRNRQQHRWFAADSVDFVSLKSHQRTSINVSSLQADIDPTSSQVGGGDYSDDDDHGWRGGSSVDYCCSRRLKKRRIDSGRRVRPVLAAGRPV
ncbi:hypothetical protein Tsubulata_020094 [Turnera subulata]|uniref:B box-type domain-containing protein n=1 Tax=Turnera subulata TaxID=218843 RepID=A0A9Q0GLB2_9ROSI|nr:hypothetical protein Tsubulata_020094 [Turnera subulata]